MAVWNEGLSIKENVETGELTEKIFFTEVYPGGDTLFAGNDWGSIYACMENDCGIENHKISIEIDRIKDKSSWTLNFGLKNKGTIPVRCLPSTVFADSGLLVECDLPDQIVNPGSSDVNPGESVKGQIKIKLCTDEPGTYSFQMDIKCIQWNAYDDGPGWWTDTMRVYGIVVVHEPPEEICEGAAEGLTAESSPGIVTESASPSAASSEAP